METFVHAESGQITYIPSDKMEIRLAAKVYQVCLKRAVRHVMLEHIVRNRLATIENNVTHTYDSLLVLSVAHLLEPERTAL